MSKGESLSDVPLQRPKRKERMMIYAAHPTPISLAVYPINFGGLGWKKYSCRKFADKKRCAAQFCVYLLGARVGEGKSRWDAGMSVLQMEIAVTGELWVLKWICLGLQLKFLKARNNWYGKENIIYAD